MAKSIYPPAADSNGSSGILPPPFGRKSASMPFFAFRFLRSKNLGNLFTPASMPARLRHLALAGRQPGTRGLDRGLQGRHLEGTFISNSQFETNDFSTTKARQIIPNLMGFSSLSNQQCSVSLTGERTPPYSLNLTYPNVSAEPTAGVGEIPEKPLEFSVAAYRRYDVSKIAEADSTSVFPGFPPAPAGTRCSVGQV
jgi:hypothetical protein